MVNEGITVELTSPTPGLWLGRKGALDCCVERLADVYTLKIVTRAGRSVILDVSCSNESYLNRHLHLFGFNITL